ncbi:MAG TPA: hypothetical protein RWO09_09720 [Ruminococcus sp.]
MGKKDTELDKLYNELMDKNENGRRVSDDSKDLRNFFLGLLMLGGGLFMIFQNIVVTSSWGFGGHFLRIGSFDLPNGMIMLPLISGIFMLFMMNKKIFGWVVLSIGILIVLLSVLLTTHITWRRTSAYLFVIMFGLVAAGGGLLIRVLFKKR